MGKNTQLATFGMGCFWHSEEAFRVTQEGQPRKGIISTTVGYMGGTKDNPTYEDVLTHTTGHVEVVQVEYDPLVITYEELLKIFWENHDPTQMNRQGPDIGENYRSVIFYHNEEQKSVAVRRLADQKKSANRRIVTAIEPALTFWPAEDYHQKYLAKRGLSTCPI
ncbi:MAG: peptide-methionine (S)-S-oxide reductase MsrA [Candidatus Yanofskybacteria bacterium]|nr:peptide-methionine (S)-S-oxide reductase MsrA [Candidatus Yanofskybacteria bacterium]